MHKFVFGLLMVPCFLGGVSADDHATVLDGTAYKIDKDGHLWRQKAGFWVEVTRDGTWKNTQRISASPSDNLLIVLQNNWLHAVAPDTGKYTVLTRGLTYDPKKMTGLCGFNKHAYFVYDETLVRVRLDGTGGKEPLVPETRWKDTEGMASNSKSMVIVQGGTLHRLFEDGSYKVLTKGTDWSGTTSIFPASEGNYVITQRGQLHLVSDVDGSGKYVLVKP